MFFVTALTEGPSLDDSDANENDMLWHAFHMKTAVNDCENGLFPK
jgi:hypothetical protein